MTEADFSIRTMARHEVDIAVDWAAREGWNPGLNDAGCFYSADPNGFLVGCLGEEPVATISAVRYGSSYGFLGFYIVKPGYRGKGYGIQIWHAGLQYLEGRRIGLDGVVAQQENYEKSGFKPAYRNIRYEGTGGGSFPEGSGIVTLSSIPFDVVDSYDRLFHPAGRKEFLKCWIGQPGSSALGIVREGRLTAYGVIRACHSGYKIGPLFADDATLAHTLFQALKSTTASSACIYLDIPEVNSDALALVKQNNMQVVFETTRMYTGEQPAMPLASIYGVTSFELG